MDDKEKELLAGFHHTISEQLNSRLSESPKFFGLLIVVATGYGYVLANPQLCKQTELFALATWLSLAAIGWASWYLAALGYAFRFLQCTQHRVEHVLRWDRFTPTSGIVPNSFWRKPWKWLWLLPGIYHAHAIGLGAILVLVCRIGLSGPTRIATSIMGLCFMALIHLYYLWKFWRAIKQAI